MVVSPEVTGFMVGPLVARALGVGFVEAYRAGARRAIAEPMIWADVPADHRGDVQRLGVRQSLVGPDDRALVVDDWAATGAQARGLRKLLGARYLGTAVIVDECPAEVSAELSIRSLLTARAGPRPRLDLDPSARRGSAGNRRARRGPGASRSRCRWPGPAARTGPWRSAPAPPPRCRRPAG